MPSAYPDIETWARQLLQRTDAQLSDADLDLHIGGIVAELLAKWPCIGATYAAIAAADLPHFNKAAGYLTAWEIRPTLGAVATGEVKRKKQGDLEIEYATSGGSSVTQSTLDKWWETGWKALRFIACVGYTTPIDTEGVVNVLQPDSILSPVKGTDEEWAEMRGLT